MGRRLRLNPHFERVPGSALHAFLRCAPDRTVTLTPDGLALLDEFATPRTLEEVLPGANASHREFVAQLVELELLLEDGDAPAPYCWQPPIDPLFGGPVWPRHTTSERSPVVVVGARYDGATLATYPRGSRDGPLALRREAATMRSSIDASGRLLGLPRVEPRGRVLAGAGLGDAGDLVPDPTCPWPEFARALESRLALLGASAKLLLLGGDHSVTLPAIRALTTRHERIGVLHFDAHGDFGPDNRAELVNHANVMRHVSALEQVHQLVQVGVRGFQALPAERNGYRCFTPRAMRSDIDQIAACLDPELSWYVSVDIDVLDPAVAPGTAAPEPGGASFDELCDTLRRCTEGRQIVGADLVEVRDVPGDRITARVGAHLLAELADALDQSPQ